MSAVVLSVVTANSVPQSKPPSSRATSPTALLSRVLIDAAAIGAARNVRHCDQIPYVDCPDHQRLRQKYEDAVRTWNVLRPKPDSAFCSLEAGSWLRRNSLVHAGKLLVICISIRSVALNVFSLPNTVDHPVQPDKVFDRADFEHKASALVRMRRKVMATK